MTFQTFPLWFDHYLSSLINRSGIHWNSIIGLVVGSRVSFQLIVSPDYGFCRPGLVDYR